MDQIKDDGGPAWEREKNEQGWAGPDSMSSFFCAEANGGGRGCVARDEETSRRPIMAAQAGVATTTGEARGRALWEGRRMAGP